MSSTASPLVSQMTVEVADAELAVVHARTVAARATDTVVITAMAIVALTGVTPVAVILAVVSNVVSIVEMAGTAALVVASAASAVLAVRIVAMEVAVRIGSRTVTRNCSRAVTRNASRNITVAFAAVENVNIAVTDIFAVVDFDALVVVVVVVVVAAKHPAARNPLTTIIATSVQQFWQQFLRW